MRLPSCLQAAALLVGTLKPFPDVSCHLFAKSICLKDELPPWQAR